MARNYPPSLFSFLQEDPGEDPFEGTERLWRNSPEAMGWMQKEEEDPDPPLDWKAIVGALTQAGSRDSEDYDPIARHRDALAAKPYTGDRGLYPDTSTPEGRSQYDDQLNSLVTGPLSLLGGPAGGIAGMADVEAQAGAEGRSPEPWERGLGAAGVIPGVGMIRKIGKLPVVTKPQGVVASLMGLKLMSPEGAPLRRLQPRIQEMIDRLVGESPIRSAGAKEVLLNEENENVFSSVGPRIKLDPNSPLYRRGHPERRKYEAAGRGDPSLEKTALHEFFHDTDYAGGEGIARLAGVEKGKDLLPFLSDYLNYSFGNIGKQSFPQGIREAGDSGNPLSYLKNVLSVEPGIEGIEPTIQTLEFIQKNYPELLGARLPKGLYEDIYSSGRRYNHLQSPASTDPTEILATLAEDPEVLRNSPALQDFIAIMEDVIMREQRRATGLGR